MLKEDKSQVSSLRDRKEDTVITGWTKRGRTWQKTR